MQTEQEKVMEMQDDVQKKLRDEMFRLSMDSLKEYLGRFGYQASDDVEKKDLVEAILTLHETQLKASDKTTAEATEASKGEDDQVVRIKFQNLESKGADIKFAWNPPDGKVEKGKSIPVWHFYDGRVYDIPRSVMHHLNSLEVPADKRVDADSEGFVQSLYSGDKTNRFACVEVQKG